MKNQSLSRPRRRGANNFCAARGVYPQGIVGKAESVVAFPQGVAQRIDFAVVRNFHLDIPDVLVFVFGPEQNVVARDRPREAFGNVVVALVCGARPVDGGSGRPDGIGNRNE